MTMELRIIENTNRASVESLEVSDSQKQFIASNRDSLETARKEEFSYDTARGFS